MAALTCTLVSEGSSDRALLPIIDFLLGVHCLSAYQSPQHARDLPSPSSGLVARIQAALHNFPCDLLVIHRDADLVPASERLTEIRRALSEIAMPPAHVCVVPVRMTEAWLLVDEDAIRSASGNPNGRNDIKLPAMNRIEQLPDPKTVLRALLEEASNMPRRRRIDFNGARQRVSELMQYEKLRQLPSFQLFEAETAQFFETWPS